MHYITRRFWIVYVGGTNGGQHKKHWTYEEARKEAGRLARKELGKTVHLLECSESCKAEMPKVNWHIARNTSFLWNNSTHTTLMGEENKDYNYGTIGEELYVLKMGKEA